MCMHINIQLSLEISLECSKFSLEVSQKMKSFYRVHENQSLSLVGFLLTTATTHIS